jgi:hypothetical protein
VVSRRLPRRAGAAGLQVNPVSSPDIALGLEQAMPPRMLSSYEARAVRMREDLDRIARKGTPVVAGDEILRMLAGRRGRAYAYANGDVKAHCVAEIDAGSLLIHVASGAAHPGDVYRPRRV